MSDTPNDCPFCDPLAEDQSVVLENAHCRFLQQPDPTLAGAGVIVPRRHRDSVFDLSAEEWAATGELLRQAKALLDERKSLTNEVAQLRRELAMSGGAGQGAAPEIEVGGVKFVGQVLTGVSGKDLPPLIDEHKARLGSGVVLLIADTGDKAAIAAGVTPDLSGKVSAVDILRAAVAQLGGKGGGGRPDLAQGGAASAENAEAAIAAAKAVLEG